jgi:hypothetical protein
LTATYSKYGKSTSGERCDCVTTSYIAPYTVSGNYIDAISYSSCANFCCGDKGNSILDTLKVVGFFYVVLVSFSILVVSTYYWIKRHRAAIIVPTIDPEPV